MHKLILKYSKVRLVWVLYRYTFLMRVTCSVLIPVVRVNPCFHIWTLFIKRKITIVVLWLYLGRKTVKDNPVSFHLNFVNTVNNLFCKRLSHKVLRKAENLHLLKKMTTIFL